MLIRINEREHINPAHVAWIGWYYEDEQSKSGKWTHIVTLAGTDFRIPDPGGIVYDKIVETANRPLDTQGL